MTATPTPTAEAQALLLAEHLRRLRLPVLLARYPKVAQDAAQRNLSYEGFLLALLEEELAQRDENMQKRRLAAAKFPTVKTLDQYDFSLMPQLNRPLVLELLQGGYIAQKENILMAGEIGTGKTTTAAVLVEEMLTVGAQVVVIDPLDAWWGLRSARDGHGAGLPIVVLGGAHGDLPLDAGNGHAVADLAVELGVCAHSAWSTIRRRATSR